MKHLKVSYKNEFPKKGNLYNTSHYIYPSIAKKPHYSPSHLHLFPYPSVESYPLAKSSAAL